MMPCILKEADSSPGINCCLYLQRIIVLPILRKTSVNVYQFSRRHIPEGSILQADYKFQCIRVCSYLLEARVEACGGGVEYLHRIPASHRRRWKWNPVPWAITGPPSSWGIQTREPGPPGWGVWKMRQKNVVMNHEGIGSENGCTGEDQQQL
jgi:hypothetical protein